MSHAANAGMNPGLEKLHAYPFEKMRGLFAGIEPAQVIDISIGEIVTIGWLK